MRVFFTLTVFSLFSLALFAQPANDDCGDAEVLSLTTPPSCPSTSTVTNNFTFDNIDATPVSPYPVFSNCPSGSTSGPAAEVWFTFTATANQTTINVNGLSQPNLVVYQGDNCVSLLALDCNDGNGSTGVAVNTLIGLDYFILVSGVDVDDQGSFDLEIISGNLCNSCAPPGAIEIIPNPPPINGTYPSGQSVQICVNINVWEGNAAGTIEWLHAVTFEFGDGWDVNSINPNPPASCDGTGSWDWYDSWTGCNTGDTFGPGFAYDSSAGVGCGGSANDGDPGNNWGDGGGGCSNVPGGAPPFEFCFNIEVGDCPPNFTGDDIGFTVEIWSDGDSGSWTQTGCNSGQDFSITSSVICCNDDPPLLNAIDVTCGGQDDGAIEMEGNGGFDPDEVFNFYVFDDNNNIVFECLGCSGLITTPFDLPPGEYDVTAINVANDCPRSEVVEIFEPDQPIADAQVLNMPCPGDLATLEGSVDLGGSVEIYTWEGPDGTIYMGQSVDVPDAGTYTLNVMVDGCPSTEATVEVEFVDFSVFIDGPDEACADTEFTLEASDGDQWEWIDLNNNDFLGDDQIINVVLQNSTTIQVTATDPNGCEAVATIDINVNDLPVIDVVITSGFGCSNGETVLEASGAGPGGSYEWTDDAGADNPRVLIDPAPGFFTYEVIGTDANGCQEIGSIDVEIVPPPEVTLELSDDQVCAGEMVTVTAVSNDPISSIDWNGAGPNNQNPITVTVDDAMTIIADVTNSEGCTAFDVTAQIGVEQPPAPPVIICGISTSTTVEFVWNDIPGATEYEVTVQNTGDVFTVFSPTFTATGFSSNTDVTITVQAIGTDLCPVAPATFTCSTLSCPAFQLDIDPVAPICLTGTTPNIFLTYTSESNAGTITWEGNNVNTTTGEFSPTGAGVGTHTITIRYSDGTCEYTDTEDIVINATPTANFTVSSPGPICVNTPVTVTYTGNASAAATYTWNFAGGDAMPGTGQGPHTVTWPTGGTKTITLTVMENGCTSTQVSQSISVVAPIATPIVTCGTSTTSSVVFNWSAVAGATSYTVTDVTGPAGVLNGTTYTVSNLAPGQAVTISVTANTNNVCGPTTSTEVTCTAANCPNFNINITPVADICLNGMNTPVTLMATATGGAGGGTFTWSGPNVVGDQFTPTTAGPQVITVTYMEDNCMASETTTINVFDTPTSTFTIAPANICIGEDATVTYTGNASPGATYSWNFNGGVATPGTGQGPHTVNWAVGGPKTVTLTVSENGCTSASGSQNITVEEPMAAPVINCSPNTTQIVFSWNAIVGATGYQVNVINAPGGAMTALDEPNRTFTVTGLMAGDVVEIEVIALGNGPCGNSSNTFSCQAQDCPAITVDIDAVAPICLTTGMPSFDLTATIAGGAGDGVFTWSGDGITDMAAGTFSPTMAGVGPAAVTVNYREAGCDYVDDIVIQINAIPTADFTASSPVCVSGSSNILYTGDAAMSATYVWDFDGGTAVPGTGQGPHSVTWPTDGDKTISLTVTENGCQSGTFTQTVTVAPELIAPMIACDVTGDSIIFTWPAVAGATDYTVSIIDAPGNAFATGGDPAQTFTVAGLTPGQTVTIEVTAISGTACPNISFQGNCALENCPDITVDITDVAPICLDANTTSLDLVATLTGNTSGTLSWMGTGITDPIAGTFDPTATGAGSFDIIATYEETSCFYADTTTIVVNAQPDASFNATGPVCEDDISIVTYTGGADPAANYNWMFDGGTIISGADAGPYEISWPDGGNPTISLTVTENGCPSDPFSLSVEVIDSLIAPIINCDSDNTSITFSWNAVAGATDYQVNVIAAPAGATETADIPNRTYTFSNLMPEDEVTIEVVVITNSICGGISSTQTCASEACIDRFFGPDTYGPFCADAGNQMLSPVITGGNVTGMITWSGDGIVAPNGTFDPASANIGDNLVTLSYEQTGCFYDTTYTVVVNPVPVADFTVTSPICITGNSTITFTGTASGAAMYDWDFAGGTIISGTGAGPYEINWATPGTKDITLTITDNDCTGNTAMQSVEVQDVIAPVVISCADATTSSVTFSWDDVAGADTYTVVVIQGPVGTQNGNTYLVDGIVDGEEVIIEVTASGNTVCGTSVATGTCTALTCQPVTIGLTGPDVICSGEDAAFTISYSGGQGTPLTIDYTVNDVPAQLTNVNDGDQISLTGLTAETTVVITQVADEVNTNCIYPVAATWTVAVDAPVNAGANATVDPVCPDDATTIDLDAALVGADAGGVWTETSNPLSTGGAFQSAAGTFNALGQNSGTYTFVYTVDGGACPDASSTVSFTINETPTADAGLDQTLTCNMGAVVLGGNSSTGVSYNWTSDNPDAMIMDPTAELIDVSAPGIYTLEVTNAAGCTAVDQVEVLSDFDVPVADVSISEVSCFQSADGAIVINNVAGGTPPYAYSLNNGTPTTNPFFGNLSGAEYTLTITDINGCFTELSIMLLEPTEVAVELVTSLENNGNEIQLGESITLQALYDPSILIDTIVWQPDSIGVNGENAVTVSPDQTMTYSVTITDINGCSDSDNMTVIVRKTRPVFVPTAFSPDGDETNDVLYPFGGNEVKEIKSFMIFNRWGEAVFENFDFLPNNPSEGWDGRFRGQVQNAAVFVYFLEVEFIDGEVEIIKGDVMLMR
ncbi:MAG: gliding motility-associated C-terminal domain-containing protein [Lewinella sp.]|uniref:T9SS type B sorting domain-containing protein n=1 Tax=Lewinella sp. TaxID=2004506 RepID=UPI003D6B5391